MEGDRLVRCENEGEKAWDEGTRMAANSNTEIRCDDADIVVNVLIL